MLGLGSLCRKTEYKRAPPRNAKHPSASLNEALRAGSFGGREEKITERNSKFSALN